MDEHPQDQAGDEVQLPEESVEDLEPDEGESDDVTGGGPHHGGWDLQTNKKV